MKYLVCFGFVALFSSLVLAAGPVAETRQRAPQAPSSTGPLQQRLSNIIIPQVDLNDASLNDTLDFLIRQASEISGGKTALNLVRLFPSSVGEDARVTFSLRQVPLTEVLRYVGEATGMEIVYDVHAVRISPRQVVTPAPDPS